MINNKVAVIGNMNNNHFTVVRFLRDAKIDAHLLLLENEIEHFLPENDSYTDEYKNYTIQLNWGTYKNIFFRNIKNSLSNYNFFIGNRTTPAYFEKNKLALNIFIPTGDDIQALPFFNGFKIANFLKWFFASKLQLKGIQRSKSVMWDQTNDTGELTFSKLMYKGNRIVEGIPMIYYPEYTVENIFKNKNKIVFFKRFEEIRSQYNLVIFHHARHSWYNIEKSKWAHDKANNRLFEAVAALKKTNINIKPIIVTCDYGKDVAETKKLIERLGLTDNVEWLPLLSRRELMAGIHFCDVVAGEFKNSWYSYGIVYEALAMGKLIMHNRKDELYKNKKELYPMVFAETTDDIVKNLVNIFEDKEKFAKIGEDGKKWFIENAINIPMSKIINEIKNSKA